MNCASEERGQLKRKGTAICKNQQLCAKEHENQSFSDRILFSILPSYNLTTTPLTYNTFLYIKSAVFYCSFELLVILPSLLSRKL